MAHTDAVPSPPSGACRRYPCLIDQRDLPRDVASIPWPVMRWAASFHENTNNVQYLPSCVMCNLVCVHYNPRFEIPGADAACTEAAKLSAFILLTRSGGS